MNLGKSRPTLLLIELAAMLLLFPLFAAVCLQIFASAKHTSQATSDLRSATELIQTAAESYSYAAGNLNTLSDLLGMTADTDGSLYLILDTGLSLRIVPSENSAFPAAVITVSGNSSELLSLKVMAVVYE